MLPTKVIPVSLNWSQKPSSGVLGITGERGSGKSVFLNKLIQVFSDHFLTVELAAPISSSREMEFFVMLFRQLTERVTRELRRRAKTGLVDIESLGKEAIQQDSDSERKSTVSLESLATIAVFSAGNARDLIRGFRESVLSADDQIFPNAVVVWSVLFFSTIRGNHRSGESNCRFFQFAKAFHPSVRAHVFGS